MTFNRYPVALSALACCLINWILPIAVSAVKFPNDIIGSPEVVCDRDTISISLVTSGAPPSHVFAKGHYNDSVCDFQQSNNASFVLSACGMARQRQLEPPGLGYNLVIVVQLHPHFITKVDRAYHIRCFYMEAEKAITQSLDVSMISTDTVNAGSDMPQCTYSIHSGSADGPVVRYAQVGDKVWHVWDCPSVDNMYGMVVHSCGVSDGQGNQIMILDDKGCGTDRFVMGTPIYTSDATRAMQETHVFKFADRVNLNFNCQIKLCLKSGDACVGVTPPRCPDSSNPVSVATATPLEVTGSGRVTAAARAVTCSCMSEMSDGAPLSDEERTFQKGNATAFLGPFAAFSANSCTNGATTCTAEPGPAGQQPFCVAYNGPINSPLDNRTITWRDCMAIDTKQIPPNECLNLAPFGIPEGNRCTCNISENCNIPLGIPPIVPGPIAGSVVGTTATATVPLNGHGTTTPVTGTVTLDITVESSTSTSATETGTGTLEFEHNTTLEFEQNVTLPGMQDQVNRSVQHTAPTSPSVGEGSNVTEMSSTPLSTTTGPSEFMNVSEAGSFTEFPDSTAIVNDSSTVQSTTEMLIAANHSSGPEEANVTSGHFSTETKQGETVSFESTTSVAAAFSETTVAPSSSTATPAMQRRPPDSVLSQNAVKSLMETTTALHSPGILPEGYVDIWDMMGIGAKMDPFNSRNNTVPTPPHFPEGSGEEPSAAKRTTRVVTPRTTYVTLTVGPSSPLYTTKDPAVSISHAGTDQFGNLTNQTHMLSAESFEDLRGRRNIEVAVIGKPDKKLRVHKELPAGQFELDINQEMLVLEPEDSINFPEAANQNAQRPVRTRAEIVEMYEPQVCLSAFGLGMILAVVILMVIFSMTALVCLCTKRDRRAHAVHALQIIPRYMAHTLPFRNQYK